MKHLFLVWLALAAFCGPIVRGQEKKDVFAFRLGTPGGIRQYKQGKWGDLVVEIHNPTDDAVEMLATTNLKGRRRQFGRRLWVPPHAKRVSSYPVFFDAPPILEHFELQSRLLDGQGREKMVRGQARMLHVSRVPKADVGMVSGVLLEEFRPEFTGKDRGQNEDVPESISSLAVGRMRAGLRRRGYSPRISEIQDAPMPATVAGLNVLENLTIAGNRLLNKPATMLAVRKWLAEGGRLWVMMDRVDPMLLQSLIGDALDCTIVDRARMNRVSIQNAAGFAASAPRDYDEPVEMLRVMVEGVEITHQVDGWPACFFLNVGRGRLMVTTLEARGWMLSRFNNIIKENELRATDDLLDLAQMFFEPADSKVLSDEELQPFLASQIGYRIADRGWVVAILGGFCLAIVIGGTFLHRARKLEWISVVGPGLAIVITVVLLIIGAVSKKAVPPTLAMEQWVDVTPGAETVRVEGSMAVFNPRPSSARVGAERDGRFALDLSGMEGETQRMIFTDYDQWRWENLNLPDGVRSAPFVGFVRLAKPIQATARLGPGGLEGRLELERFEQPADAILVTRLNGNMALRLTGDQFTVKPEDVLPPQRFIAEKLLTQTQRRRQQLLETMWKKTSRKQFPKRQAIFVWTRPAPLGFHFPEQTAHVGEALLSVPLLLLPSRPGKVVVPGPMMSYRSVSGPARSKPSAMYDHRTGQWTQGMTSSSVVWLSFSLPPAVMPLKVDRATLNVVMDAPGRNVVFTAARNGKSLDVAERLNPSGRLKINIDKPDHLEVSKEGTLTLGFEMSTHRAGSAVEWAIKQLQLEVTGTKLNPAAATKTVPAAARGTRPILPLVKNETQ